MVDRLFVEKKPGFDNEARAPLKDARSFLGVTNLTGLRLFNRYDVEGLDAALLMQARDSVFSEPQLDDVYDELPQDEGVVFATEYLPGQFDQRADSAAQCIQLIIPEFLIFCKTFLVACFCKVFFQYCLKVCQFLRIGCSIFIISI